MSFGKVKLRVILGFFIFCFFGIVLTAMGQEESLELDNLDKMGTLSAPVVIPKSIESKWTIMGRIDLTARMNEKETDPIHSQTELKNLHQLKLFLKLKASPKTSFFGEIVDKTFYYAEYKITDTQSLSFGKIIVPFGDTRFFHYLYGGVQSDDPVGLLLPKVWTETGFQWQMQWGNNIILDSYIVNGFKGENDREVPNLTNAGDSKTQAIGTRLQYQGLEYFTFIASIYFNNYWNANKLFLFGGDFYTDYGAFSWPVRISGGIANERVENLANLGLRNRRADYMQLAGMGAGPGEWRVRYGTYNDIVEKRSPADKHSWSLAYTVGVDVIRLMIEKQWNFEEQNETKNDYWRLMASVDF